MFFILGLLLEFVMLKYLLLWNDDSRFDLPILKYRYNKKLIISSWNQKVRARAFTNSWKLWETCSSCLVKPKYYCFMVFLLNLPLHIFKTLDGFLILSDTIKQRKKAEEPSKTKARISHNLIWHPVVKGNARIFHNSESKERTHHFLSNQWGRKWRPRRIWHPQGNGFRRWVVEICITEPSKVHHGFLCFRVEWAGVF